MYVFVTSKCNMACLHCCHMCRPGVGQHMTMETFKQVVRFSRRYQYNVMIGGGEPTLNPRLLEMIDYLEKHGHGNSIWMTMNGTCSTELYKELLAREYVTLQISNSIFHNRAIQNPFVMRSGAQRGLLTETGYEPWYSIELTGRALLRGAAIEALAKKKRRKVDFCEPWDKSVCILPDGQVCKWEEGRKYLYGPLTKRNYDRAHCS